MAGPGRALRERHALGDLDDAQGAQLAGPRLEQGGADPDELAGGARVGDRDEDPDRQRGAVHPAFQRSTRYGLSSSNSRAWRSTRSSASSVVMSRFSITKLATRPK